MHLISDNGRYAARAAVRRIRAAGLTVGNEAADAARGAEGSAAPPTAHRLLSTAARDRRKGERWGNRFPGLLAAGRGRYATTNLSSASRGILRAPWGAGGPKFPSDVKIFCSVKWELGISE